VRFVDTASPVAAEERHYGISMYPLGGIHWNALAAALAARQVIAALNAQPDAPPLGALDWTWHMSDKPEGEERDLLDILNLRFADWRYTVPHLTYDAAPAGICRPAHITEVGGSFLFALDRALSHLACPPAIAMWFYWEKRLQEYPADRATMPPLDAAARRQSLRDADIVIFEENEASGPVSKHGEQMMAELPALMARAGDTR
ncbi:MAG: hypothetical protein JO326_05035, partial [Acetobacteraceae bacterium]|nr:hypothetical protein [Acetobacteraceae bacterium]